LICLSDNNPDKEKQQIEMLTNGSIDGIIVAVTFKTSQQKIFGAIKNIIRQELPIVLIDRNSNNLKCDKIILNTYQEISEAADYLIKTNCKNIALVSDYSALHSKNLCVEAFKKALTDSGIDYSINAVFDINDKAFAENITARCLSTKLDGVVCLSEGSIIKTVLVLNELKLKIPNKVSVIGITNSSIPEHFKPPITTIGHLGCKIADTAASVLLKRIEQSTVDFKFNILSPKCTIVQRKSTKKLYV
jgi:LacI family transcriptional regulator